MQQKRCDFPPKVDPCLQQTGALRRKNVALRRKLRIAVTPENKIKEENKISSLILLQGGSKAR